MVLGVCLVWLEHYGVIVNKKMIFKNIIKKMLVEEIEDVFSEIDCKVYMQMIDNKIRYVRNLQNFKHEKFLDSKLTSYIADCVNKKYSGNINHISSCIVIGKYDMNEHSHLHTDPSYDDRTDHRLLIYLNDNFEGGKTSFYDNNFKLIKKIDPKAGKAIIFKLDVFHHGEEILSKDNKYFIACQVSLSKIKKN